MGSRGLAPLDCLPLWGREGVTLAISSPTKKNARGFLRSCFFVSFSPCREQPGDPHAILNRFIEKYAMDKTIF